MDVAPPRPIDANRYSCLSMLSTMAKTELNLLEMCKTPIVAPVLSDEAAESLARVLKAVADPMRIKILHRLTSAAPEDVCVCDLIEPLGLTQPTVSHHLRVLREAGLLDRRHEGSFVYYSVRESAMDHLATLLAFNQAAASA